MKYETAKEELTSVENEILRREEEVRRLEGCGETYTKAFEEKLKKVRLVGKQALRTVDSVLDDLDDAEGWAAWDTFGGGGLISDMMKYDHLDEAQTKINTLQIEDFLKFADYFFDGLFADWTVMDKIEQSTTQVKHTKTEIISVISKLEDRLANVELCYQRKAEEREKLVLSLE